MDKNTLSTWGWIIVTTIIIAFLIVMTVPFADSVTAGIKNTVNQAFGIDHECTPGPEATCTTAQRCTECNKLINPPSAHLSDAVWDSSDINHWNNCAYGCGTKLNFDVHSPNQDVNYAFCDEEVYCTICSFVIKEAKEHNKVPATNETPEHCTDCDWVNGASLCQHTTFTWQYDGTNHWKLCSDCGTSFDEATHTPDDLNKLCDERVLCTDCGCDLGAGANHYDGSYINIAYNDTEHWYFCEACGQTEPSAPHNVTPATCEEPEMCYECGWSNGTPSGHDIGAGYEYDETQHWATCATCKQRVDEAEHDIVGADYVSNDTEHWQECWVCGMALNSGEHIPDNPDAYCVEDIHCADCGYYLGTGTEHEPSAYNIGCDDEGHWDECMACGFTGEKYAHEPDNPDAYCVEDIHCADCGYYLGTGTEHEPSAYNIGCDDEGHWDECMACGFTGEKYAHVPGNWEDMGDGYSYLFCSECGYKMDETYDDPDACPACGNNPCTCIYPPGYEEEDDMVYCQGCGNYHSPEGCPYDDALYECPDCLELYNPSDGHSCSVDYEYYCSYCGAGVGYGESHWCDAMDGGSTAYECPRCGGDGNGCCSEEDYIEGYCGYCGAGIPFGGGHYCDAMQT